MSNYLRSGTEEESRVVECVIRWLQIRGKEMPEYNADWLSNLEYDSWHSALLRRLLDGKEPDAERPPILDSYPVYSDECFGDKHEFRKLKNEKNSYQCIHCGARKQG